MRVRPYRGLVVGMFFAFFALVAAGCSGGPSAAPDASATPSATASAAAGIAVDWAAPQRARLPGGWSLAACSGDAPLVCVAKDGRPVGFLETLRFEITTLDQFEKVMADDGAQVALEVHALRFVTDFHADRTTICVPGYQVTGDETRSFNRADGPLLRYGFTGTMPDGTPSEKVVTYGQVQDGRWLVLLVANANEEGGCLGDEGEFFTTADLVAFTPLLDEIVAGSGLPPN